MIGAFFLILIISTGLLFGNEFSVIRVFLIGLAFVALLLSFRALPS